MAEMPTMQLTVHEGEPVYSLGELLALYAEYEAEYPVPTRVVCMDNSHLQEAIGTLSEAALKLSALAFLKWLAARDIGPRLRPTVRLT